MHLTSVKSGTGKGLLLAIVLVLAGCASGPLTTREKGTLGGAALGAGAGAIIGEATDHSPGKGALIGGALGGLGGALVGGGMQSQDTELAEQQRDLERQQYELDRQRRELEDLQRRDDYYGRDDYYRRYGY
jgi:uncharacterized protein YcfJ